MRFTVPQRAVKLQLEVGQVEKDIKGREDEIQSVAAAEESPLLVTLIVAALRAEIDRLSEKKQQLVDLVAALLVRTAGEGLVGVRWWYFVAH